MSQKVFTVVSVLDNPEQLPEVGVIGVFSSKDKAIEKAKSVAKERFANHLADYQSVDVSELSRDECFEYGWFEYDMSFGFSDGNSGIGFEVQIYEEKIQ